MSTIDRSCVIRLVEAQAGIPDSANKRSVRVLKRGSLDVVLGTPANPDEQTTHEQDEVYIVVRGRGVMFHDGKRDPFGPGDFIFVAAATEHWFEDFSDDLHVWRVFYGPNGGDILAQRKEAGVKDETLRPLLHELKDFGKASDTRAHHEKMHTL